MQEIKKIYNLSNLERRRTNFDTLKFGLYCEGIEIPDSEILSIPNLNDGLNKIVEIRGLKFELISV